MTLTEILQILIVSIIVGMTVGTLVAILLSKYINRKNWFQ